MLSDSSRAGDTMRQPGTRHPKPWVASKQAHGSTSRRAGSGAGSDRGLNHPEIVVTSDLVALYLAPAFAFPMPSRRALQQRRHPRGRVRERGGAMTAARLALRPQASAAHIAVPLFGERGYYSPGPPRLPPRDPVPSPPRPSPRGLPPEPSPLSSTPAARQRALLLTDSFFASAVSSLCTAPR